MEPPICSLCYKDFRDDEKGGDLLFFKRTEEDDEFDKRAEEPGFAGHPPRAAWFCNEHLEEAKKLTHLTLYEALRILRKKFGK